MHFQSYLSRNNFKLRFIRYMEKKGMKKITKFLLSLYNRNKEGKYKIYKKGHSKNVSQLIFFKKKRKKKKKNLIAKMFPSQNFKNNCIDLCFDGFNE